MSEHHTNDRESMAARLDAASMRVGLGTDRHRLVTGRPLVLGGVTVPSERGCDGHSDGDALLHAIIDACLGAAGLGDIGEHFPDTDARFRDADSATLLTHALASVSDAGFTVVNVDGVVMLEAPKLGALKATMRERIAGVVGVSPSCVNVAAKTGEGVGAVGRGECVDAMAIVLLVVRNANERVQG